MITVTNEMVCGNIAYESGNYKMDGDYKVEPNTKKLNMLNVSITKNEIYSGSVNAYKNGDELAYNYNSMKQEDVTSIATGVATIVSEIEGRYANGISLE